MEYKDYEKLVKKHYSFTLKKDLKPKHISNILTYVAIKLSGFEENRVIGSGTVLDTARLKYELGEHLGVDSRTVHAYGLIFTYH